MLRNAKQPAQSGSRDVHWYFVALVTTAIAVVEIFTDAGLIGLGNAALSPLLTKACIDLRLKPVLLGADPWDTEYLWQQMYRRTMAFGRKGVAITAISAVEIALWDLMGKSSQQPVYRRAYETTYSCVCKPKFADGGICFRE